MNGRHSAPHGCRASRRLEKWIVAGVACVAFFIALVPLAAQGNDVSLPYGAGVVPAMVVPSLFLLGTALVLLQWLGDRRRVRLFAVGVAVLTGIINIPEALRVASAVSWSFLLMSGVVVVLAAPYRPGWRLVSLLLGVVHGINLLGRETGIPLLPEEGGGAHLDHMGARAVEHGTGSGLRPA